MNAPGDDGSGGRRRLPTLPPNKSPRPSPRPSINSAVRREGGYVQFGLCFEEPNLLVTLWAAEGLKMVESADDVSLPTPYAIARLCMFGYV